MRDPVVRGGLLALVWAAVALPSAAQDPIQRTGRTCTLVMHAAGLDAALAARLADAAIAAAERTRPVLEKWQLVPARPPTVHLYADADAYRVAFGGKGKSGPGRDAFVVPSRDEAHVLLHPARDARTLQAVGLPASTGEAIVVALGELVACARSDNARNDPWRARLFAYGLLEAARPVAGPDVDPAHDSRRASLLWRAAQGESLSIYGWLQRDEPADEAALRHAADEAAVLAQLLAGASGSWVKKVFADPPKDAATRVAFRTAVVDSVLGKDHGKNDARLQKLLQAAAAKWVVVEPSVAMVDGRLLLVGGALPATLQALALPPAGGYAVRGTFELLPHQNADLRVQLDWDERSLLAVFLYEGGVSLKSWTAGSAAFDKIAEVRADIPMGKPFEVAVEFAGKLRVRIGGQVVVEHDCAPRTMRGRWSVAMDSGPVWIRDLRCEPLVPAK